jgi:hypothetical protein
VPTVISSSLTGKPANEATIHAPQKHKIAKMQLQNSFVIDSSNLERVTAHLSTVVSQTFGL